MPIKVEDFSWSETEQMVFITVPLKVRHVPGTVHVLDFNRPRSTLFEACDETGSPAVVCNDNRTLRSNPLPSVPWTLLGTCRGSNQQKQTSIQTSYTLRCPPGMFALHSHSLKQLLCAVSSSTCHNSVICAWKRADTVSSSILARFSAAVGRRGVVLSSVPHSRRLQY